MTLQEQNMAIGKALGWNSGCPPDYARDLNACAEMEKTLPEDTLRNYCEWLSTLSRWPSLATAAQRAEAFLRTLNLWKE